MLAYHITLFDLFPPESCLPAAKVLACILDGQKSFALSTSGLWKSQRGMGYVGLKIKDSKNLRKFRSYLFNGLKDFKPQETGKKFRPHITLARYKDFGFADEVKNYPG